MADNYTTAYGAGGRTFAADEIADVLYPRVKLVVGPDGAANGDVSATTPLPVAHASGVLTDRSGTITTGGTAQQLAAANAARLGFSVQNLSTGDLWVNTLGTAAAAQPSIKLAAGVYFETPAGYGAVGAISIFGATTGQAFSAREW